MSIHNFIVAGSHSAGQKWLKVYASKSPIDPDQFKETIHKPRQGFEPPLLRFGFAFRFEQVLAFFKHNELKVNAKVTWEIVQGPDYHEGQRSLVRYVMVEMMRAHLEGFCGTTFKLATPFSRDYSAMIEIYNNYDVDQRRFTNPQDEVDVIEILRDELDGGGYTSEAKWWYDNDDAVSHELHRWLSMLLSLTLLHAFRTSFTILSRDELAVVSFYGHVRGLRYYPLV